MSPCKDLSTDIQTIGDSFRLLCQIWKEKLQYVCDYCSICSNYRTFNNCNSPPDSGMWQNLPQYPNSLWGWVKSTLSGLGKIHTNWVGPGWVPLPNEFWPFLYKALFLKANFLPPIMINLVKLDFRHIYDIFVRLGYGIKDALPRWRFKQPLSWMFSSHLETERA